MMGRMSIRMKIDAYPLFARFIVRLGKNGCNLDARILFMIFDSTESTFIDQKSAIVCVIFLGYKDDVSLVYMP
jgi:hypothetical protein